MQQSDSPAIGPSLEALAATIAQRANANPAESYTARLLQGSEDKLLKKIGEEACEVVMAAKDGSREHVLYESADLVYHLLVVFQRYGVTLDQLSAELETRREHSNGERTDKGESFR